MDRSVRVRVNNREVAPETGGTGTSATVVSSGRLGQMKVGDYLLAAAEPSVTGALAALCPDLLRYEQLGPADTWRGRVVRGFFRLLRWWQPA